MNFNTKDALYIYNGQQVYFWAAPPTAAAGNCWGYRVRKDHDVCISGTNPWVMKSNLLWERAYVHILFLEKYFSKKLHKNEHTTVVPNIVIASSFCEFNKK